MQIVLEHDRHMQRQGVDVHLDRPAIAVFPIICYTTSINRRLTLSTFIQQVVHRVIWDCTCVGLLFHLPSFCGETLLYNR